MQNFKPLVVLLIFCAIVFPRLPALAEDNQQAPIEETAPAPQKKPIMDRVGDEMNKAGKQVGDVVKETENRSYENRKKVNFQIMGNYSLVDMILPSKYGVSVAYFPNVDSSWELEYMRGSVSLPFFIKDLGSMTESRLSVQRRSHIENSSFNFFYGLTYFNFRIKIGNEILSRINPNFPKYDLLNTSSLGFNLGVGTRWIFDNGITLGMDWGAWAQPLIRTKKSGEILKTVTNQSDRDAIDTAIKVMSYFPRFYFLKFQVGGSF